MDKKEIAGKIFREALRSVNPSFIVKGYTDKIHSYYSMKGFTKLIITGFGKAAYQMAQAAEEMFDNDQISGGIVVTKYGHAKSQLSGELKKIKVLEAAHPVPDENGFKAAQKIIKLLKEADSNTLVLCLISGGGSALFVSPCEGVTLSEKQSITDLLLKAGADITELNSVRKHLSAVKGGRLAEIVYPAKIISLLISDVIGDKMDVIASGPTAPDSSTYQDALEVLKKFNLLDKAPGSVVDVLKKGAAGIIPDTPKQNNPIFHNIQNIIIGSNKKAIDAAYKEAEIFGLDTEIISAELTGEAKEAGKWLAKKALDERSNNSSRSKCLISGGETTVIVKGNGKGGRNTELALSFAMEIDGIEGITFLSAGTDGTDGPTDAAGAIVDGQTISKAKKLGLNPQEFLDNNDSYNFFRKTDSLLITGPTGTNVMDIQIAVIA
ncbi:MAG: glycerate kinase [Nitrospirota bacterium]